MTWMTFPPLRICASILTVFIILPIVSQGQWLQGNLKDTTNQADYIIIAPPEYVPTIQPLASFRATANPYSVAIVLLDSITAQFQEATPDSDMRAFLTYTLTSWRAPHPQYLLLAGNVNRIPSHRVADTVGSLGVYTALIDQWFVDQLCRTCNIPFPSIAIGRLPAWNQEELAVMVDKTLQYEQAAHGEWERRGVALADSEGNGYFEWDAQSQVAMLAPLWTDTMAVHSRESSPSHRSTKEFLSLWNQGIAVVSFVGGGTLTTFGRLTYFATGDLDSLAAGSPLAFCLLSWSQPFDTSSLAVELLRTPERGAVCAIVPTGLMIVNSESMFSQTLFSDMVAHPDQSIGMSMTMVKRENPGTFQERITLLGDPALIIKHPIVSSVNTPKNGTPLGFELLQNYPNPFNPTTKIQFTIVNRQLTIVKVFDLVGRKVATLVNEVKEPGTYTVQFDGSVLASGVYLYRLQAGDFVQMKRMLLVK
jgi:hypothetical protein